MPASGVNLEDGSSTVSGDPSGRAVPMNPSSTTKQLPQKSFPWRTWTVAITLLAICIPICRYVLESNPQHPSLSCNISSTEVLSAIQRATTPFCKAQLEQFGCLLQEGRVYPPRLPSFCPSEKPAVPEVSTFINPPKTLRILFVLTVHGRDSRQVRRLLRLVYRKEHFFLIHVDRRSEFLFNELLPLENSWPNIKLIRRRHSPIWGGATLLTTLLDVMRFGLEQSGWKEWDYLLNLSESDLPIKSNDELVEYLASNYGSNFVKSHGTSTEKFIKRQGLDKSFFQCEEHMWQMGVRTLPEGIVIDGGSDWVVLHREFCQYLLDEADSELLSGLRTVYNYTLLPAESFFHTVLHNTRFCHSRINNNLRLTNWRRDKGCNCQYKHIVDWCGCSPNVFREQDEQKILSYSPRPIFFARKFDPFVDLKIINLVLGDLDWNKVPASTWQRHWLNLYVAKENYPTIPTGSLFESLSRLATQSLLSQSTINMDDGEPEEHSAIHSVHVTVDISNQRNFLVAQHMQLGNNKETIVETLFGFKRHFRKLDPQIKEGNPVHRILDMQVSTEFDQKEEIFRNYAMVHGPYSNPSLAYTVAAGDAAVLSVVWLDPADVVAGSFELTLTSDSEIGIHQPEFIKPLRPGKWSVHLMYKWKVIATTEFLVLPISLLGTNFQSHNLGPERNFYIDYNFTSVAQLFPSLDPRKKKAAADVNGRKIGRDLTVWTDHLVKEFFAVEDVCVVADKLDDLLGNVMPTEAKLCRDTTWSSFVPDDFLMTIPA